MIESTVLAAGFWHPAQVRPHLPLSGPFWLLHKDLMALTQRRLRPGLLHEGGGVLIKGCVCCTRAPPLWSTPEPCPAAPALVQYTPGTTQNDPTSPPAGWASDDNQA